MSNTSIEIELLMRDSTRKGLQAAESSITDYQRMTEAIIKRLEGDITQMQSRLSKGLDMDSFVKESAKVEALTSEVEKLKRVIEELDKRKPNSAPLLPEDPVVTKKKFDGLSFSFQQMARELPALTMGPQMFFLAISNNLPMFTDQIAIARKEYEALIASGQKATPVWKQVAKSMFSWQTAMMVGISLLIVYGKDIVKAFKNIGKSSDALNTTKMRLDILKKSLEDYKKNLTSAYSEYGKQVAVVNRLSSEWSKLGNNLSAKQKYIKDNKKAFKELGVKIKGVKDAENLLVDNTGKFIKAMSLRAQAIAGQQTLQELYSKQQKADEEAFGARAYAKFIRNKKVTQKDIDEANEINRMKRMSADSSVSSESLIELVTPEDIAHRGAEKLEKQADELEKQRDMYISRSKVFLQRLTKNTELSKQLMKEAGIDEDDDDSDREKVDKIALANAITDAQVEAQKKLEEAKLAVMMDGYNKRKRLAKQELTDTLNDINKSERDQLKKLDDAKKKGVDVKPEQYDKVKNTAKDQRIVAAQKYADDYWNIEKEAIEKQQELSEKERQGWIDYNKEFGTYRQKKLAIVQDYVAKLSSAETAGEKASLKKAMEQQLKELDFTRFKDSIDFSQIFGNLDNLSTGSLERLRDKLGKFIKEASKSLSPENSKELSDAFIKIDFKISERDPFKELKESISDYKQAVEELKQAEEAAAKVRAGETVVSTTKYDAASGKIVKTLLTQEQAEKKVTSAEDKRAAALEKMNKSLHSGVGKAQEYLGVASAITGALESFGVEVPEEIGGAIEGFGQTLDSLASIDVTNPMSIVTGAIGAVAGLGKGIMSLFGSAKELSQETIDAYNNYISVIDDLIAKQQELIQSTAGSSAVVLAKETEEMIRKQMDATRDIGKDYFNSGASWKSSSHGVKQMDVIKRYRKELQGIGIDISQWGKRGTELFDLSADELTKIQKDFPKLWAELDESTRSYLQNIIDGDEKLNEILDQRNQSLTGITFDEARAGLKSLLMDADTTMADVAGNFEEYMRQAIINTIIDSTLQGKIKEWYSKFSEAMDEKTKTTGRGRNRKKTVVEEAGILNDQEKKELQELYTSIYTEGKNLRDNAYEAAGINPEDITKQSGRAGAFTTMTQDQGTKLEGLFTSVQDHTSSLDDTCKEVSGSLQKSSETLTKIEENTRRTADGIETLIRDGLKMK